MSANVQRLKSGIGNPVKLVKFSYRKPPLPAARSVRYSLGISKAANPKLIEYMRTCIPDAHLAWDLRYPVGLAAATGGDRRPGEYHKEGFSNAVARSASGAPFLARHHQSALEELVGEESRILFRQAV